MLANSKFKLFLPGLHLQENNHKTILVIDLGASISKIALFEVVDGSILSQKSDEVQTLQFNNFQEMVSHFLQKHSIDKMDKIIASVPGFVLHGKSISNNLKWELDSQQIKDNFAVEKVFLINDLEAAAYGLAGITDQQLATIFQPDIEDISGNMAILAPGNGLGEAGLYFDGDSLRPFATEGGHCEFSPRTNTEVEFYQFLSHIYGIVSWENVLTKKGLFNIYRFLRDVNRHPEPDWLQEHLSNGDFSEQLYIAATEKQVGICQIAIETYLEFLAREANSLALKMKTTGGLILAGDLPLMLLKHNGWDNFYDKFKISDKMENLLKEIPIHIVTEPKISLYGAAYFAAFSEGK